MVAVVFCCVYLLAGAIALVAADVRVGSYVKPWSEYPSGLLDLDISTTYTAGPVLTLSTDLISSSFWYGIDPNRIGFLCVQGAFGVPTGDTQSLQSMIEEVGWRLTTTGPAFLSASVSRLRWGAYGICNPDFSSSLTSTQVGLGGGLRFDPIWVAAEYGIRWSKGSPDFTDVSEAPQQAVSVSFGLDTQINPIDNNALRYPIEHFASAFTEDFPLGCDDWNWEGQAGYIRVIDEQLGILVDQEDQTILRTFDVEAGRYAIDLDIIPRSVGRNDHSFGVIFRYENESNYYSVELRTDGYVRLARVVEGDYEPVTEWRRTRVLTHGVRNRLRVLIPGNQVIVYLNGVRILVEEEVSFTRGLFGVFAKTLDYPGTWVAFDNIDVREYGTNIILDPRSQETRDLEIVERIAVALVSGVGAFISNQQGLSSATYGFVGMALYELFRPSGHLLSVY
ncbi:hypothetical protein ACFLSG_04815 [Candidatus Bipolaricaulota bacterium]